MENIPFYGSDEQWRNKLIRFEADFYAKYSKKFEVTLLGFKLPLSLQRETYVFEVVKDVQRLQKYMKQLFEWNLFENYGSP